MPVSELSNHGLIKVDIFQSTSLPDVFAVGDNSSPMRSVTNTLAAGNIAGAVINNGMTAQEF